MMVSDCTAKVKISVTILVTVDSGVSVCVVVVYLLGYIVDIYPIGY